MARRKYCAIALLLPVATLCTAAIYGRPHIILILADDLVSTSAILSVTTGSGHSLVEALSSNLLVATADNQENLSQDTGSRARFETTTSLRLQQPAGFNCYHWDPTDLTR
jgi:hypothetical protein